MKEWCERRYKELGWELQETSIKQSIRINTLRSSAQLLLPRLHRMAIKTQKIPFLKNGYWVRHSRVSPGATNEYLQGYYYLQEAAAQIPVEVLDPQPGEVILDCCAAPGGKTTQIAQHMENKGKIVAYEMKKHRVPSLLVNLERMGVTICSAYNKDATVPIPGEFDRILVDAPCSGNFSNDTRWFDKRSEDDIYNVQETQRQIMKAVTPLLKKGGILIYSTCSLEPEENECNVDWFLKKLPLKILPSNVDLGVPGITEVFGDKLDPSISHCRRLWPGETQGFFIAKLEKC